MTHNNYTFLVGGFLMGEQPLSLTLHWAFSDMLFSWKAWRCFGGLL